MPSENGKLMGTKLSKKILIIHPEVTEPYFRASLAVLAAFVSDVGFVDKASQVFQ
jgi:NCAIR mutase (PurE)-related protein